MKKGEILEKRRETNRQDINVGRKEKRRNIGKEEEERKEHREKEKKKDISLKMVRHFYASPFLKNKQKNERKK